MAISTTTAVFRKSGDTLNYMPAAAVPCGSVKVVDGLVCIALWDLAAGEASTLKILHRGEVVEVTTNESIGATNAGVAIYVDANGLVTKTATNNTLVGYTAAAVAAGDLSFEIVCV